MNEEFFLILEEAYDKQLLASITIEAKVFVEDDIDGINIPALNYSGYILKFTSTGFIMLNFIYDEEKQTISHRKNAFKFEEVIRACNNYQYENETHRVIQSYISIAHSMSLNKSEVDLNEDTSESVDIIKLFGYEPRRKPPQIVAKVSKKTLNNLKK